jgi:hypothetical protein
MTTNTLTSLKLLDIVALVEDLPQHSLSRGQVGTLVEQLAPDVYEVEFSDDEGQTYAMLPLHTNQLISLHYLPIKPLTRTDKPTNNLEEPTMNSIYQYGKGDNIAGDKVMGDKVMGDKIGVQNNYTAEPKTPAEAAKEIQDLLLQLAKDNPLASDDDRATHLTQKLAPNRLQRITEIIQAAGEAAVEEIPGGKIAVAVLKKVREQETLLNQAKPQQQLPPKP